MAADWLWDDALDALVVAPAKHRLVFENAHVRVLDTRAAGARPAPEALWGDPLEPHSLENVGTAPLHIISTEVKSAAPAG